MCLHSALACSASAIVICACLSSCNLACPWLTAHAHRLASTASSCTASCTFMTCCAWRTRLHAQLVSFNMRLLNTETSGSLSRLLSTRASLPLGPEEPGCLSQPLLPQPSASHDG